MLHWPAFPSSWGRVLPASCKTKGLQAAWLLPHFFLMQLLRENAHGRLCIHDCPVNSTLPVFIKPLCEIPLRKHRGKIRDFQMSLQKKKKKKKSKPICPVLFDYHPHTGNVKTPHLGVLRGFWKMWWAKLAAISKQRGSSPSLLCLLLLTFCSSADPP